MRRLTDRLPSDDPLSPPCPTAPAMYPGQEFDKAGAQARVAVKQQIRRDLESAKLRRARAGK